MSRIDDLISIWSMRPKPGTVNGDSWERGARQGWQWAQDEIERLRAELDTRVSVELLNLERETCDRIREDNDRLRAALKECADDLESEVEYRYDRTKDHPAMTPKYERDMEPVKMARALLGEPGRR